MMQPAKIHLEIFSGITGLIWPLHLSNARRFTAVKVSTEYTETDMKRLNQRKPYVNGTQQELDLKSSRF